MTNEEMLEHLSSTLEKLENMLHSLGLSDNPTHKQKAMKVAYWLKSYSDFVLNEDKFNINSYPSYKYRSIINVDFGFRLGSEIGGWHYAVVLDKNNNRSSDTVTVVPLVSLKLTSRNSKHTIILPNGIYDAYNKKLESHINIGNKLLSEAKALLSNLEFSMDKEQQDFISTEIRLRTKHANQIIDEGNDIAKQIRKLKGGTVACISQITTISKRRIVTPKSHKHILYNIKISEEEMKLIQNAIVDSYINKDSIK